MESFTLTAHLGRDPQALAAFEEHFWKIATPGKDEYLQFLSLDEIAGAIGASDAEIELVAGWLVNDIGGSDVRVSSTRDTVTASFSCCDGDGGNKFSSGGFPHRESLPDVVEFVVRRDPKEKTEEEVDVDHPRKKSIEEGEGSSSVYTVQNIKRAYGIPDDLEATNDATLQMVWGPGTFGYSKSKLAVFKASQCPLLNMDKVFFDTDNHGTAGGDNFGEGELDTSMIASFGLNVSTLVSNTNTSASTEETTGFGAALLDFLTELAARDTVPHVLSMSLGSLSAASCDLLCDQAVAKGYTAEECQDYMATQRQVCMFLSQDQTDRINVALQVLGTRGVTVLGSSGDGGSHFSFGPFEGGGIADALNEISCEFQIPVFPTASPFLVSVGGEMWDDDDSEKPITWAGYGGGSGSGFSIQFDMSNHQKTTVADYLTKDGMPPADSFDASKRAYPDISAVAVDGTSQSCPITAGIWSMIIDMRLNAGLPSLGFVSPRIYQIATAFPGEAWEDIVEGNSCTSCDNGFPATDGWDANTGFGRPVWQGLVKHFGSDDTLF